jgi:hypothetical protein
MPDIWEWPRPWYKFSSSRFYLRSASQMATSRWTGRRNVYGPHAQIWVCELEIVRQDWQRWQPMEAFFANLGGQAGLMRIGDPQRRRPQYSRESLSPAVPWSDGTFFDDGTGWNSSPLPPSIHVVTGAAKGATSIVVGGLPASQGRVMRRNDLFELRPNGIPTETPNLYSIMRDAPTDANGRTRIQFKPALRAGIAVGDTVVLNHATSVFRLIDDEQGIFDREIPTLANAGFKLLEAIG